MSHEEQTAKQIKKLLDDAANIPEEKKLMHFNGVIYPGILCSEETFKALESFEAREDDLMLVSYPKCGTNWSVNLLNDIVKAACNKDPSSIIPILEFGAPDKFEKLNQEPSPRVLATHLHYDNIPQKFFDKKLKMLVVFRNPKDTAVSYYHFYNSNPMLPNYSSWDTFFEDYKSGNVCWGSYFDHALAWNKHIDDEGVLIMTFEEMKEDLTAAVKKLSTFFGLCLNEEQSQEVAGKGTFTAMKTKLTETRKDVAHIFLRKGEVGDWKNHFSEAQSQEIDAKFEACLAGTKLGEMLKYNVYCK